jgi:hypothetical protein
LWFFTDKAEQRSKQAAMYGIEHYDENKLTKDANSREKVSSDRMSDSEEQQKKHQLCPLSN